ncbi:hypothetical protein DNI29_04050 [Hymenobacter sediminis]|uniref:hypothetical protein n=1 Tax=Hymenobacter sediminis TaxID=2218621 RepID=UPI000F4ECA3A|nr:hypothetical protein [Hymenobacter sediminis]RPD49975.1 hypothetical protein DNI29_04050 [Hymenobacter sediminis]
MQLHFVFLGLLVLWSCESKSKTTLAAATPAKAALLGNATTPATVPTASSWQGDYEGSLSGKYPFRLSITAQDDSKQVRGWYYYLSQQKPIWLEGYVTSSGDLWLGEINPAQSDLTEHWNGSRQPRQPFAYFHLRRTGVGVLAGTWRAAKSERQLSTQLTSYRSTGFAEKAHVGEQTYFGEFTEPVFTVPDSRVSEKLWEAFDVAQLAGMTWEDLEQEAKARKGGEIRGYLGTDAKVTYNDRGLLSVWLRSEQITGGGQLFARMWSVVMDLRTGEQLTDEIDPAKRPAFLAVCEQKLQRQISRYLHENPQDSTDEAGLRSQHVTGAGPPTDLHVTADSVTFHHEVDYEGMTHFVRRDMEYHFRVAFAHTELAPFLKPDSPLQRLVKR